MNITHAHTHKNRLVSNNKIKKNQSNNEPTPTTLFAAKRTRKKPTSTPTSASRRKQKSSADKPRGLAASNPLLSCVKTGKHIPFVCYGPHCMYTYVSAVAPDQSQHRRLKGITDAIFSLYLPSHHKLLLNGGGGSDQKCGPAFGSLIDKQLQQWTAVCASDDPTDQMAFAATCHEVVRGVIALFKRNKWRPWRAQVPVCSWHSGLGTCIDLIAQQEDGSLILIEVKTGYTDNFSKTMTKGGFDLAFHHPLDSIPVSPLNYALLQALVSWYMYHETYDDRIQCSKLYVLHLRAGEAPMLFGVPERKMATMMGGVRHLIRHYTHLAGTVVSLKDRRRLRRLNPLAGKKKKTDKNDKKKKKKKTKTNTRKSRSKR